MRAASLRSLSSTPGVGPGVELGVGGRRSSGRAVGAAGAREGPVSACANGHTKIRIACSFSAMTIARGYARSVQEAQTGSSPRQAVRRKLHDEDAMTAARTRTSTKTTPMLFTRQRQLLQLLDALGGSVAKFDFQKLLFLYCQEASVGAPYDFVPYEFGP